VGAIGQQVEAPPESDDDDTAEGFASSGSGSLLPPVEQ